MKERIHFHLVAKHLNHLSVNPRGKGVYARAQLLDSLSKLGCAELKLATEIVGTPPVVASATGATHIVLPRDFALVGLRPMPLSLTL